MKTKHVIGILLAAAVPLLIPLIAMQYTTEVNWDLFDFIVAWVLLAGTGLAYAFAVSRGGNTAYRAAASLALSTTLLLIWITLAVGIIGSEDNPMNLLYMIVPVIGFIGAILSGRKPRGMAYTVATAAVFQALIPVFAFMVNRPDMSPGVMQVIALNLVFTALYAGSALLFWQAQKTLA